MLVFRVFTFLVDGLSLRKNLMGSAKSLAPKQKGGNGFLTGRFTVAVVVDSEFTPFTESEDQKDASKLLFSFRILGFCFLVVIFGSIEREFGGKFFVTKGQLSSFEH